MSFVATAVVAAFAEGATAAVILTAVTEVGIAMTVVGKVTGSTELTKIGSVMSLVGGVGGIVNGIAGGVIGAAGAGAAEGATDAALSGVGAAGADAAEAGWSGIASDAVSGINAAGTAPIVFDGAGAAASGVAGAAPALGDSLASTVGGAASNAAASNIPAAGSSGVPGLASDTTGMMTTPNTSSPFLNEYGLPANGATDKVLGVADLSTPADGGLMDQLKSKFGAAWDGLGSQGKAEVLKSVLAMPGGIQNQKNIEDQIAIQQQRTNQTSYGSQVPTFGIINKAKG